MFSVRRLSLRHGALLNRQAERTAQQPLGGTILAGISSTLRSPYLLNICLYMLLFSITSTTLYFEQADMVRHAFAQPAQRTAFFATLDLIGNILTLAVQLAFTGRIVRRLGVPLTLALIPVLSVMGFGLLAVAPALRLLVVFAVLRRSGNFAIARPVREVLFTVVPREDKYKAKMFIDTVMYRTGDQIGAWTYAGLGGLGLSTAAMAAVAVVLSGMWLGNSLWLGWQQEKKSMPG